jgi:hypothetical protein
MPQVAVVPQLIAKTNGVIGHFCEPRPASKIKPEPVLLYAKQLMLRPILVGESMVIASVCANAVPNQWASAIRPI